MNERQEGPVPAELMPAVVAPVDQDAGRDWLMVRTAAGDWAGKVAKADWASFVRPLADWQIVLLGDAYELQQKMDKLLVQATVPPGALAVPARELLTRQWWAMDALRQVLRERIAAFGAGA